jgi:tetratricopeptide (TPR) repeat protein
MENKRSWIRSLFGQRSAKQADAPSNAPLAIPNVSQAPARDVRDTGPAAWKVGDLILGEYEVTGILGEGGMGIVYKVYHRPWNMVMAVKSPKPEIFTREGGKENFIREAETWVSLGTYPHLVRCYSVETLGGIPRVFAEYVQGGSLADWIRQRRLYEGGPERALERILDVTIQFARGLHFAHEQGLVHQDIKPANVMMTQNGVAKVTDFGLAKARAMADDEIVQDEKEDQSIMVSSRGMTLAYCSPEQAGRQAVSRKTDIWSWGLSVLEMFTGEVTWTIGVAAQEILAGYEQQDPTIPGMPAELRNLLARCFQQAPEARPATMLEVATELQEIYAHSVGRPYGKTMPRPSATQVDSLINRANSLLQLGRLEEAMNVSKQAIQLDPNSADAYYNLGGALQELKRAEEALATYEQVIRLKPSDVEAHNHRGSMLVQLGRPEEALVAYERAVELDPKYASATFNRGNVLALLGRREEALAAYEQAIQLDPNFVNMTPAPYRKALERPKDAPKDFEQATRIDAKSALAYYNKGIGLAKQGRLGDALVAFEQAVCLNPKDVPATFNRGNALAELGRPEEALVAYEQTLRLDPNHARAYTNKGGTLAKLGRPEEALVALEQAIHLNPKDAFAYMNKGTVLGQLGRGGEALAALEQAIRLNPSLAHHITKLLSNG